MYEEGLRRSWEGLRGSWEGLRAVRAMVWNMKGGPPRELEPLRAPGRPPRDPGQSKMGPGRPRRHPGVPQRELGGPLERESWKGLG